MIEEHIREAARLLALRDLVVQYGIEGLYLRTHGDEKLPDDIRVCVRDAVLGKVSDRLREIGMQEDPPRQGVSDA